MNYHRHGEVILKQIKTLPTEATLVEEGNKIIIGHSESGHHHVLTLPKVSLKMFEFEGKTYLHVPLEAKLSHQKTGTEIHETQVIAPGIYERITKRAFSYAEKIMKKVTD